MKKALSILLPAFLLERLLHIYHLSLAWVAAIFYGYPARTLIVVGVTGTKGKTSVTEMVGRILEAAGHQTAILNSIRFKVGDSSEANTTRMSMPGRFFIQRFLSNAHKAGCTAAVLEMTSEGARQNRHRFIDLDALIFTNLAPEHLESHGSYEAYANAKFEIGKELVRSRKRPRIMVANADDKEGPRYMSLAVDYALPVTLSAHSPSEWNDQQGSFTFEGIKISLVLPGEFSVRNALLAATVAHALGIAPEKIAEALGTLRVIPGRAERIEEGQNFAAIVDYAHTPDSLKALYSTYPARKVCVLSATGGGRDAWKRPVMGAIAEAACGHIILTDEDPYDEDPLQIVNDITHGMQRKPEIIMDRRAAIRRALELAQPGDAVLITGKGTNHSISIAGGKEIPWDDATVVREELKALMQRTV